MKRHYGGWFSKETFLSQWVITGGSGCPWSAWIACLVFEEDTLWRTTVLLGQSVMPLLSCAVSDTRANHLPSDYAMAVCQANTPLSTKMEDIFPALLRTTSALLCSGLQEAGPPQPHITLSHLCSHGAVRSGPGKQEVPTVPDS